MTAPAQKTALAAALVSIALEFQKLSDVEDEYRRFVWWAVDMVCEALAQPAGAKS